MIHEAYYKDEIAFRYYKLVADARKYTKEQARKQLIQDKNIDFKSMEMVVTKIHKEQIDLLKKVKNEKRKSKVA